MQVFSGIFGLIPPILIFIASIYYLNKSKSTESTLLAIGSGLSLLMAIFYPLMSFLYASGTMETGNISSYYTIAGVFNFLSNIIFAIGFCMLLFKLSKQLTNNFSQFPPNTQ